MIFLIIGKKKLHLEKHIHPSKNFPIYLFISKFVKGGPKKKKKKRTTGSWDGSKRNYGSHLLLST
jgi:hypothetical protein